jgi:hypothetical protein
MSQCCEIDRLVRVSDKEWHSEKLAVASGSVLAVQSAVYALFLSSMNHLLGPPLLVPWIYCSNIHHFVV